jgi:hypothetical protein
MLWVVSLDNNVVFTVIYDWHSRESSPVFGECTKISYSRNITALVSTLDDQANERIHHHLDWNKWMRDLGAPMFQLSEWSRTSESVNETLHRLLLSNTSVSFCTLFSYIFFSCVTRITMQTWCLYGDDHEDYCHVVCGLANHFRGTYCHCSEDWGSAYLWIVSNDLPD